MKYIFFLKKHIMQQSKELIRGHIANSEFEHIKVIYLKKSNREYEQQDFNNLEGFTEWYKKQDFNLYPTIFGSEQYHYKIEIFCSWETKEYLENNFEFSNILSSCWVCENIPISTNIPNSD